jgi:hypothetical protein
VLSVAATIALPSLSLASTAPFSHVGSVCLRERAVLQPRKQADASEGAGQKIMMVRVTYCDLSRPVCYSGENEVAMSICRKPAATD